MLRDNVYFTPEGVQNTVMSIRYVCLFACLSVHSHRPNFKTTRLNFTKSSVHVACGRVLVLLWRRCDMLCIAVFMDDVMFSYYGPMERNEARHYV